MGERGRAVRLILPTGEGRGVKEAAAKAVGEPEPAADRELGARLPGVDEPVDGVASRPRERRAREE